MDASRLGLQTQIAPSFFDLHHKIKSGAATHFWLKGGRGCVHGDTVIQTPSGGVKIRDFSGGRILSFDNGKVIEAFAYPPVRYAPEPLLKITTDSGVIICTARHRILTFNGWKEAAVLSVGDILPSVVSACGDPPPSSCVAFRSVYPEDARHYLDRVLGFLCYYFEYHRQCDGRPLSGRDTFLDVLPLLADEQQHNYRALLRSDEREHDKTNDLDGSTLSRLSILADSLCEVDRSYIKPENYSDDKFSGLPSVLFPAFQQFHERRNPHELAQELAKQILFYASSVGSEPETHQTISGILSSFVLDNSYSDSFMVSGYFTPPATVKSIEEYGECEFFDFFVPRYNNYIAEGLVHHNSCKSSFASLQIIWGIRNSPDAHAICYRKYQNTLRESVFNQVLWAIEILGWGAYFRATTSPMEITYKPTGQKILFKGLDDASKSKSIKLPFGYFKYAWFEELEQYDGLQEIRNVCQSLIRGSDKRFCYFYSYNPPQTTSNWVNYESSVPVENRIVHHSNYLSVPRDWLGSAFFTEADILRKQNELAYRHEYLGEITGTGGSIFTNLVNRTITDEEISHFCNTRKGIDWGYAVDPFAYGALEYDKMRRTIYIYDEIYKVGLLNDEAIRLIKAKDIGRDKIIADSAEPKSIAEFRRDGINIQAAEKGKDSVPYGIKFLQKLAAIVIDPVRCPNTWKEFSLYEFEKTKTGEFKSEYPDRMNHAIDLVRYSLSCDMEKRGMF